MAIKRVIGIDFGTSTSVVKTKRYEVSEESGKETAEPIGNAHHTDSVTFGQGVSDPKALTIVRVNEDGSVDCGTDEEIFGATLYRDFKMLLESEDEKEREKAKELTHEYMSYLYRRYDIQKKDLGEEGDELQTIVSFPAKWKDETRRFIAYAVSEAGFENVSSIDEPSAALFAVMARQMDVIRDNGFIEKDKDNYILVIDMGAGTTDLAVCKCSVDTEDNNVKATDINNELVMSWPDNNVNITFGGREIDKKLKGYLTEYLVSCNIPIEYAENCLEQSSGVKTWKETHLSPTLEKGETVTTCSTLNMAMYYPGAKRMAFPPINKEFFEKIIEDKLADYITLVKGCLDKLEENAEIDVVILTGGHSSWYFAKELIDGTMKGIDHPALKKVQAEKQRVMRLSNPQETVALGMVYSKLPFNITKDKKPVSVQAEQPAQVNPPVTEEHLKQEDLMSNFADAIKKINNKNREENNKISLLKFVFSYLEDHRTSAQQMSLGNLSGLKRYLNIPDNAVCYLWNDTTWFSSGKNGFVITDKGFYYRELWTAPGFLSWDSFINNTSVTAQNNLLVFKHYGSRCFSVTLSESKKNYVYEFFTDLQMQSKLNNQDSAPATTSVKASDISSSPVKINADTILDSEYLNTVKSFLGNPDPIEFGDFENVYFTEFSKSQKDTLNYMISKKGIHDGHRNTNTCVTWNTFVNTDIITGNKEGNYTSALVSIVLPFGGEEISIVCNDPQETADMLLRLKDKLAAEVGTTEANLKKLKERKKFFEIVETSCQKFGDTDSRYDYSRLAKSLGVPIDAKIFYAEVADADKGTMITDKGIFSTCFFTPHFGEVHIISWKEFVFGTIINHPVDGIKLLNTLGHKQLYKNSSMVRPGVADFYEKLQNDLMEFVMEISESDQHEESVPDSHII